MLWCGRDVYVECESLRAGRSSLEDDDEGLCQWNPGVCGGVGRLKVF
jgi:hypothetical protein